jgi:AcrR family transcriptional regulator
LPAPASTSALGPRRIPVQQRARDSVERILDEAATLLDEVGVDGFNTNLLAERAGVRVRTVYRYFPNKLAVVVALAERNANWESELVEASLLAELDHGDWKGAIEHVTDRYVSAVLARPGFLAVRRATRALPELRDVDDRAGEQLARQFSQLLRAGGVDLPAQRTTAIGRAAIEAAIAVLDLAYASPPRQRRALIDELKRMQIAYLATYLDR